ncbi:MAG: hypothetical protein ACO1SV_07435 [Fimbriimonas sp.]
MENEIRDDGLGREEHVVLYRAPETDLTAQQRAEKLKQLATRLMWLGVEARTVERLLASYDPERVERQLDWIGARRPRNAASLIVAAIDADYPPPMNIFGGRRG